MTDGITSAVTLRPVRRAVRRGVIAAGGVVIVCLLCVGGLLLSLLGDEVNQTVVDLVGCGNDTLVNPNGALPLVSGFVEEQVRNAAIIVRTGQDMKVSPRGWVIAVATALQESSLNNLPHLGARNDHDSIGLFQQRPSQGWGTLQQLADPAYQARKFFEKMVRVPGWQMLPLTVVAQRVQISAFPNAYGKHEPTASQIIDAMTGGASRASGGDLTLKCAAAGEIAASGWTVPVLGPITSGFRTASRPTHNGVDIGVPKGTPIHAASAGVVLVAVCNAHVGPVTYGCDRDGGVWVQGCGWYVDILHAAKAITRYCHMREKPYVTPGKSVNAGDIIGLSGSSGNSSGPHVHFEIHLNQDSGFLGAVDPLPFMYKVGAPLVNAA